MVPQMTTLCSGAKSETGWGARIRTWEWRYQKPLPYRLATPHPRRVLALKGRRREAPLPNTTRRGAGPLLLKPLQPHSEIPQSR